MNRIHSSPVLILGLLLALLASVSCFHETATCGKPKIIEYLTNYTIPTTDLRTLI